METKTARTGFLSGNALKLIAALSMTIDHIGVVFFPRTAWLRIVGRLALPIFAFMIAEGCRYTRNRGRYLLSMVLLAAVCQLVSFVATGSLYQCILVTFSFSILLIWLLGRSVRKPTAGTVAAAVAGVALAWFVCDGIPVLLPGTDYGVDYGFLGVLLPLFVFFGRKKWEKLVLAALGLGLLCIDLGGIQWYAMAALLPLAFYSGQRGKKSVKYLFYIYYPAHIAALYLIAMFL